MLTDPFISSIQGEYRATHDVDLLVNINITHAAVPALIKAFPPPDYYIQSWLLPFLCRLNRTYAL